MKAETVLTDQNESILPTALNAAFLRGFDPAGGGGVNVPKDALFEDVFTNRGDLRDIDDATLKSGIYGINFDSYPGSGSPYVYGGLIVFNGYGTATAGNPILQMVFNNVGVVSIRVKWWTSPWTDWRPI